jgi:diguanylate cyclase (GGDEF)-like protein
MRRELQDREFAFRRGGEEFVIVLDKGLEEAQILAEKIRFAIAVEPVNVKTATEGDIKISISASFGVANTFLDEVKPSTLEDLADQRMREAKTAGKNCVRPTLSSEAASRLHTQGLYK